MNSATGVQPRSHAGWAPAPGAALEQDLLCHDQHLDHRFASACRSPRTGPGTALHAFGNKSTRSKIADPLCEPRGADHRASPFHGGGDVQDAPSQKQNIFSGALAQRLLNWCYRIDNNMAEIREVTAVPVHPHRQTPPTKSLGLSQATYRPFLRQILEEVFHPERLECPDIEHMSGGLTDLLKTGFSMFMKVSRPHPSDNPLLVLFLVGGVTPSELRLIKEIVTTHKPGTQ
ncbi:hypothetical protein FQN60_013161, partial [Etheostoma spectabile]